MPLIRRNPDKPAAPRDPDAAAAAAALRSGTPEERWSAARSLGALPGAVSVLGDALGGETDDRVREAILTSLVRINSAGSVDAVLPLLRSDDATLRTGALDALKAMPDAVFARLTSLLRDADPDVRILACDLTREVRGADAALLLSSVLETDPVANVCAAAAEALAEIGSEEFLPVLARCTERFPDQPFLRFVTKVAAERIASQTRQRHG
jgi:HEAT repeat protein